jgi:hypothetical protein
MAVLILIAAAALVETRLHWVIALVFLAVAINFKVVAILLSPLWLIGSLPCRSFRLGTKGKIILLLRRLFVLVAATVMLFVPYFVQYGAQSLAFVDYHRQRGFQLESLPANLILFLRYLGMQVNIEHSYGSTNLALLWSGPLAGTALVLTLGLEAWTVWRLWKGAARCCANAAASLTFAQCFPDIMFRYAVLILAIGVCGSKVFSPQYILWFVTLVPLVLLPGDKDDSSLQWVFFLVVFFTMLVYPVMFDTDVRPIVRVLTRISHKILAKGRSSWHN